MLQVVFFNKITFVSFLSIVLFVPKETCATASRPHIIFILADDAGWNDFSFHGSAQIPTPNIDALAFGGAVLNSYYGSPLCTPSRGAILTGKYPIHLGLQHYVIRGDTAEGLPLSEKLLPEHLKELGYSTHLVGKWHLGHARKEYSPTFRGFDTHFGYWLGSQDYYAHTSTDAGHWGYDARNGMEVNHEAFGSYNTDLFTEETVRLIHQQPIEQPLFLMVTHTAPHAGNEDDPLQAPQENIDKFQDSIADINRRVYAGYNLNYGSNWPLRGVKNTLWEGGTRLAACIWSPQIRNRVSTDIMHTSDWLPTLLEAAGGNVTDLEGIDGVSLWPTLTSTQPSPRHTLLYNIDDIYNNSAVRFETWKLIQGNTSNSDLGQGPWDGWYGQYESNITVEELIPNILSSKVATALKNIGFNLTAEEVQNLQHDATIQCSNNVLPQDAPCNAYEAPCLFNIIDDPCEQNNLADTEGKLVQQLLGIIKSFNDTAREIIDLSHHPEAAPQYWRYVWTNWKDFMN